MRSAVPYVAEEAEEKVDTTSTTVSAYATTVACIIVAKGQRALHVRAARALASRGS